MKTYDGYDIRTFLGRKGYTLTDVGRELGVTPQAVHLVIWGAITSQRIVFHIERLLGWTPGKLKIARRNKAA